MGSVPTPAQYPYTPQQEETALERINKQGMSDQGIVSPEEGLKALQGVWKDLKTGVQNKLSPAASPNKYGREASAPMTPEQQIEEALKAAEQGQQ
jgi:hypothetical protein